MEIFNFELMKKKYLKNCRAKRRNMERMTLACGGQAMNTFDDMDESCLGYAGVVYEHVLGENKFTFVEECKNPLSVTILLRAGNKHTLTQMKVCCSIFSSDLSFNRSSRRKRGMASNPLFIIPDFFCIFQTNLAMATLGLKEFSHFLET